MACDGGLWFCTYELSIIAITAGQQCLTTRHQQGHRSAQSKDAVLALIYRQVQAVVAAAQQSTAYAILQSWPYTANPDSTQQPGVHFSGAMGFSIQCRLLCYCGAAMHTVYSDTLAKGCYCGILPTTARPPSSAEPAVRIYALKHGNAACCMFASSHENRDEACG